MSKFNRPLVFLCVCVAAVQTASAQWARQMVDTTKIDFGVIATGSEAKKFVEVKNVHPDVVHIASVDTTCGCSAAAVGEQTLQPGDSVLVEVKMNTQKFRQRKDSNLVIKFDRPAFAEVRIPITAYIRTDVVFEPGMIRFGDVEAGTEGTAVVDIAYAGRPDWDIENIKIANKYLKATLKPVSRTGGNINYRLTMTLSKEASVGRLRDVVTIVTNDRTNPYVPLMVEGAVTPDITITPQTVAVKPLAAGQSARVQVVIRAKKPFKIEDIDCEGMADCFKATISDQARVLHQVPIEFSAPNRPGKFSEELIVRITGRPEPLRFNVTGTITN
ncbi:MAG: DUF1573 domain-containing protein [Fuerstiella sp.]